MSNEKPILFKDEMIRAILDGRKTQTRRIVKPCKCKGSLWELAPHEIAGEINRGHYRNCPYGKPGDRLWVRESTKEHCAVIASFARYAADNAMVRENGNCLTTWWYSRPTCPSIHMPRWASRITLEITDIRVERLQKISRDDAIAEGAREFPDLPGKHPYGQDPRWSMEEPTDVSQCLGTPRAAFANYWCKVNGKKLPGGVLDSRPWDENPWVWVIEFKRVE